MGIRKIFCFVLLTTVLFGPVGSFAEKEKGMIEVSLRFSHTPDVEIREMVAGDLDTPHPISVTGKRHISGAMPRQRNPELSSHHLVVVALNGQGSEINRDVIPDPRSIRTEAIGLSGEMTSNLLYAESVDFSIVVPDHSGVSELKIYHPRWTGSEFILERIAQTKIP